MTVLFGTFLTIRFSKSLGKSDLFSIVLLNSEGVSLNSECLQGPNLMNNLVNVLLQFRQYNYALMADIELMYLQVRIPELDRNVLRFLWSYKLDDCVVEYRMMSHLFGGIWCIASSAYALRRTVLDCELTPLIADMILRSFYIDDMLKKNIERHTVHTIVS